LITSAQNPKIQRLRALFSQRKAREESGEAPLEGVRLVEDALAAEWQPRQVFFTAGLSPRGMELAEHCRAHGAEVEEVDPRLLKAALDTENPQGLAAVFALRSLDLPARPDFLVVADGLRDPGNLGTLLRTAEAAGAQGLLLAPGTVEAFSPKVLRAGMGAHFRLPILALDWAELERRLKPDLRVYLADAAEGRDYCDLDMRLPLALVIGGEAEGVSPQARRLADGFARIPMPGRAESLNAAVAAGVLLFEVVRQRRG
jgi:TrmH family RNA methyltransferase